MLVSTEEGQWGLINYMTFSVWTMPKHKKLGGVWVGVISKYTFVKDAN